MLLYLLKREVNESNEDLFKPEMLSYLQHLSSLLERSTVDGNTHLT